MRPWSSFRHPVAHSPSGRVRVRTFSRAYETMIKAAYEICGRNEVIIPSKGLGQGRAQAYRSHQWVRLVLVTSWLLAGCASSVPEAIRSFPPGGPAVAEVKHDAARFVGTRVRWGGTIALVENRRTETLMEVVDHPVDRQGRPIVDRPSQGRFLARFQGFFDPAIYKRDRLLTVVGTVQDEVTRPIGDYAYSFPLVDVESYSLWEPPRYQTPCWWYDYPWSPYWGYTWRYGPYCW